VTRTHRFFLLVVAIAAVVAGVMLRPNTEEHVTMLIRDGQLETAEEEIRYEIQAGNDSPVLLFQLYKLLRRTGEIVQARQVLVAYLAAHPDDTEQLAALADMYLEDGRVEAFHSTLEDIVARQPSAKLVQRLLGSYRLYGQFRAEMKLMLKLLDSPFLRPSDLERLGALMASQGDTETAIKALTLADKHAAPTLDHGRLLLFKILLDSHRYDAASEAATRWAAGWHSLPAAERLVERLAAAGQAASAARLAEHAAPLFANFELTAAQFLNAQGQGQTSLLILARWSERIQNADAAQIKQYVSASWGAGDAVGPFRALHRLITNGAEAEVQAELAEELASTYGLASLAPFQERLGYDALMKRPVFGANLAVVTGNYPMARRLLSATDLLSLRPEEIEQWFRVIGQVATEREIFNLLADRRKLRQLPGILLRAYAQMALRLGQPREHDAVWQELIQSGL
jgi:hypothetical protein